MPANITFTAGQSPAGSDSVAMSVTNNDPQAYSIIVNYFYHDKDGNPQRPNVYNGMIAGGQTLNFNFTVPNPPNHPYMINLQIVVFNQNVQPPAFEQIPEGGANIPMA